MQKRLDPTRAFIIAGIQDRGFVVKYAATACSTPEIRGKTHVRQHDADAAFDLGAAAPCGRLPRRYRDRLALGTRRDSSLHLSRCASARAAAGARACPPLP